MESNAFSKSIKTKIPEIFFTFVYCIRSFKSLTFWPINLSFIHPVWSEWISLGRKEGKVLYVLQYTVCHDFVINIEQRYWAPIGRHSVSSDRSLSFFGIKGVTPLLWDIERLPFWKASLYESSRLIFCFKRSNRTKLSQLKYLFEEAHITWSEHNHLLRNGCPSSQIFWRSFLL